ncbi:SWIM zinc finger family protein [Halolamina sp. C58]|uniref:SWIM zinc finger family protein n=1 Tax=Halolamina sp. C58 TaxID=3421640 RepID=UPI003EBF400A
MSTDRVPPSTDQHAPGERLDFDEIAGTEETSWARADPKAALIESTGRYGFRVTLPDGDGHLVAVAIEDGEYVGTCDCKAWEYHDGPCAHLCAVRKAAFLGVTDARDEPVSIPRLDLDAHETDECAAADGGYVDRAHRADATGGRR